MKKILFFTTILLSGITILGMQELMEYKKKLIESQMEIVSMSLSDFSTNNGEKMVPLKNEQVEKIINDDKNQKNVCFSVTTDVFKNCRSHNDCIEKIGSNGNYEKVDSSVENAVAFSWLTPTQVVKLTPKQVIKYGVEKLVKVALEKNCIYFKAKKNLTP